MYIYEVGQVVKTMSTLTNSISLTQGQAINSSSFGLIKKKKKNWSKNRKCSISMVWLADDIVVFTTSERDLQAVLNETRLKNIMWK